MILADSSAWIEYDRGSGAPAHVGLAREISRAPSSVAGTEPVLMEVLAGASRQSDAERLRAMLTSLAWIPCDPVTDFEGAATLYRRCRAQGITPRSLDDCLIATIALRADAVLLTADRDFEQIARVMPLRLYTG